MACRGTALLLLFLHKKCETLKLIDGKKELQGNAIRRLINMGESG
jgi:hypothetical protein